MGRAVVSNRAYHRCVTSLDDLKFLANFIVLWMYDYDVIFGMDGLSSYNTFLNYFVRTITFRYPDQDKFVVVVANGNLFVEALSAYIKDT